MKITAQPGFKFFVSVTLVFVVVLFVGIMRGEHITNIDGLFVISEFVLLILSLSSLGTLFMRTEIFSSWLHFLYWWIAPLLIAYTLSSARGGGFSGINPWEPLFPVLLGLFVISTPIYLYIKSKRLG